MHDQLRRVVAALLRQRRRPDDIGEWNSDEFLGGPSFNRRRLIPFIDRFRNRQFAVRIGLARGQCGAALLIHLEALRIDQIFVNVGAESARHFSCVAARLHVGAKNVGYFLIGHLVPCRHVLPCAGEIQGKAKPVESVQLMPSLR